MVSATHVMSVLRLSVLVALTASCSGGGPSAATATAQIDAVLAIPPSNIDAVDAALGEMSDPIVRQAALFEWAQRNQGRYAPRAVVKLCERLTDSSRMLCLRRLVSPHLAEPLR